MFDNSFKSWSGPKLEAFAKWLAKTGIKPNHLTISGLVLSIVAATCVGQGYFLSALFVWWFGRFFDGFDGIFARTNGMTSPLGSYLDITADMAAYCIMVVGWSFYFPEAGVLWSLVLMLYAICIASALAAGQIVKESTQNRGLAMALGLAEGGETSLFYTLLLLLPEWHYFLTIAWIVILCITLIARTYFVMFKTH